MATDNFYQDPMKYMTEPPRASVDKRKIETLFTKYRSKPHTLSHTHTFTHSLSLTHTDSVEEDKMLAEGVSRFCDDAGLDPTSLTVLIIAWKFRAATQCEFSRKEFVNGMTTLG